MTGKERARLDAMKTDLNRLEKLIAILEPMNGVTFANVSTEPEEPCVTGARQKCRAIRYEQRRGAAKLGVRCLRNRQVQHKNMCSYWLTNVGISG
jgi:hypothetical protein